MAVTLTCVFLPGNGLPFALAVALISVMAVSEFYRAVRRQGAEPSDGLGLFACIVFQLAAWRRDGHLLDPYLPALLTLLVLVTMLVELIKPKHKPILNIGATLLGAIYCGWLFSFLVLIHGLNVVAKAPISHTTPGQWLVAFVIGVTAANDSGGLFIGNWLGRHKLAPSISPSKTWEGAVGGLVLSILAACGVGLWIHLPIASAIAMGAVFAIVGLIGDLCESALKRELGVKDFGVILPGHGGILDRIDSVIFTAPVAYYIFVFLLVAHH
jgi:phosphatidate cytidylyltransferase